MGVMQQVNSEALSAVWEYFLLDQVPSPTPTFPSPLPLDASETNAEPQSSAFFCYLKEKILEWNPNFPTSNEYVKIALTLDLSRCSTRSSRFWKTRHHQLKALKTLKPSTLAVQSTRITNFCIGCLFSKPFLQTPCSNFPSQAKLLNAKIGR